MDEIKRIENYEIKDNQLVLKGGKWGNVYIRPFSSGVIKVELVRTTPWSETESAISYSVIGEQEQIPFSVIKKRNRIIMVINEINIEIMQYPFSVTINQNSKKVLINKLVFNWDGWKVGFNYIINKSELFYGLGQTDQNSNKVVFNHKGNSYFLWNKHLPAPSRLILPFLINPIGYGLFIDNQWPAKINIGNTQTNRLSYFADGGNLSFYIILGNEISEILARYAKLTGKPTIPPRFIFGMLQSKFGYRSEKEVNNVAEKYRKKRIPCDGIIIDLYWFKKMGDMHFDKKAFKSPKDMVYKLKERGFNVILIEEPYVVEGSRLYEEGKKLGVFAKNSLGETYMIPFWPGKSAIVDFTNPLSKQWWANQHYELIDIGVAGWWADLNEPEEHPQEMLHFSGPAAKVHNIFALEMQKSINLAYEQHSPDKRVFIMSRSGWAGMQRYGAGTWSGDVDISWEALEKQLVLGINMGLVGVPYWNTDIGGFNGENRTTPELFIRWLQFGSFTPIMRPHGYQTDREPWSFGKEAEKIIIQTIKLRYLLIPYIYTLAFEAYTNGLPLMRPLAMYYPNDFLVSNITDQYLFGKDLLVAPIVKEGARERLVYLPEGNWFNFWTNEKLSGGKHINVDAPLDRIPLFVKADAILPLLPVRNYIDEKEWSELILLIYPENNGEYTLYEDDGNSTNYQEGEYTLTHITQITGKITGTGPLIHSNRLENKKWTLRIERQKGTFIGQVKNRVYKLTVIMEEKPKKIMVNKEEFKIWEYNKNEKKLSIDITVKNKEDCLVEVYFE